MSAAVITTERLRLRPWKEEDLLPYSRLNADPLVREFFPTLLTREESDREVRRFQERYKREGFCLFAAELIEERVFIGFIGVQTMAFAVRPLAKPPVEIGWRLATQYWGKGLATEGALAVLEYAFTSVGLRQVVAITVPQNKRSRAVMEKIGMRHHSELDFAHPQIPEGHPLRQHVFYSIGADGQGRGRAG